MLSREVQVTLVFVSSTGILALLGWMRTIIETLRVTYPYNNYLYSCMNVCSITQSEKLNMIITCSIRLLNHFLRSLLGVVCGSESHSQ